MKRSIIFLIGLALFSNTLIANSNINRILGITAEKHSKEILISKTEKRDTQPKKITSNNSQIDKLLEYTKIKKTPQKETAYGLKIGYQISEHISVSVDVLAKVDIQKSKIKSKEANLQFALSL